MWGFIPTARSELPRLMTRRATSLSKRERRRTFLPARIGRLGASRNAKGDITGRVTQRAFGRCDRDLVTYGPLFFQKGSTHTEKAHFGIVGVGDKPPVKCMRTTFYVGRKSCDQAAGAAFGHTYFPTVTANPLYYQQDALSQIDGPRKTVLS